MNFKGGGGSGSRWVGGYPVWGFRIEKKSPDFRSPEVGISVTGEHIYDKLCC